MKKLICKGWRPCLVIILLLIIWEAVCAIMDVPKWLLPPPSVIADTAITNFSSYIFHLLSTVELTVIGFIIGVSIGIIVALLLHLIPFFRQAFYPLLILSQNIPIIVLAPLLVIWFGFGTLPKLVIITLVCFFPITVSALDGFRQTSGDLRHYMRMAGASKSQIFWKLEMPSALPAIFSGLKIAATYSVMGAVISEWLGAKKGIGVYMTLAQSSFQTARVFVAIGIVMVLSLLFFALIMLAEKWAIRWQGEGE